MKLIEWNEKYSVHNREIDTQHKRLFDIINTLHDAMKMRKGREATGGLLAELVDYTYYHFDTEEKLFRLHNYPHLTVHKSEHDLMKSLVADLESRFNSNADAVTVEFMVLLKDWLSDHVLGSDQKYGAFIKEQGAI